MMTLFLVPFIWNHPKHFFFYCGLCVFVFNSEIKALGLVHSASGAQIKVHQGPNVVHLWPIDGASIELWCTVILTPVHFDLNPRSSLRTLFAKFTKPIFLNIYLVFFKFIVFFLNTFKGLWSEVSY